MYLYEPYDELVLMNLGQFDKKFLKSIENEIADDKEDTDTVDEKGKYHLCLPQVINWTDMSDQTVQTLTQIWCHTI